MMMMMINDILSYSNDEIIFIFIMPIRGIIHFSLEIFQTFMKKYRLQDIKI